MTAPIRQGQRVTSCKTQKFNGGTCSAGSSWAATPDRTDPADPADRENERDGDADLAACNARLAELVRREE